MRNSIYRTAQRAATTAAAARGFASRARARCLTQVANWRRIFYIYIIMMGKLMTLEIVGVQLMFQVPGTILWFLFYHPLSYTQLHGKKSSKIAKLKKVDWIGVFLLTAGLSLLLVGISWGRLVQPWLSPRILGLLISGAMAIISFILYETFLMP